MLKKYRRDDKSKTIRAKKQSKKTKLYERSIGALLGKRIGQFDVKSFHDVYGGKYRFLCRCTKCNKDVYILGTRLKSRVAKCMHCHVVKYGPKTKYTRVAPYGKRGPYRKKDVEMICKEPKSSCSVLKVATIVAVFLIIKEIIHYVLKYYWMS